MASEWTQGDYIVVDEGTGTLRPYDPDVDDIGQQVATIDTVEISANGYVRRVHITFSSLSLVASFIPAGLEKVGTIDVMAQTIRDAAVEVAYTYNRVPPLCWVCGLQPASEGPNEAAWFQQYFHARHRAWMPVCQDCVTAKMELRS